MSVSRLQDLMGRASIFLVLLGAIAACGSEPEPREQFARSGPTIYSDTIAMREPDRSTATCSACRIVLERLGTIGSATDTVYPVSGASVVQGTDQRFYVAKMSLRGRIGAYDREGMLLRLLGRQGEGPGEMRTVSAHAASNDSQLVVLGFSHILRFPLSGGEPVSQVIPRPLRLPRMIVLPGGGVIVNNWDPTLRNFTYFGENTSSFTTFGDSLPQGGEDPATAVRHGAQILQRLAPVDSVRFWAVPGVFTPVLDEWRVDGVLLGRYRLPAPWFAPYGPEEFRRYQREGDRGYPVARTTGIHRDAAGYLWTVTQVADPEWSRPDSVEQLRREADGGVQAVPWGYDRQPVLDAVIAVYEMTPAGARLLAATRVDEAMTGFLSDTVAYAEDLPEGGLTTYTLYRFRFLPQP